MAMVRRLPTSDENPRTPGAQGIAITAAVASPWWESPGSWMCIATDTSTGQDIAGTRLDIAEDVSDLPAFRGLAKRGVPLPACAHRGPVGETCGLWVSAPHRGVPLSYQLLPLSVVVADTLGLGTIYTFPPTHTQDSMFACQFRRVASFGDDGSVVYPRAPYVSTLMVRDNPCLRAGDELGGLWSLPRAETTASGRVITFSHDLTCTR